MGGGGIIVPTVVALKGTVRVMLALPLLLWQQGGLLTQLAQGKMGCGDVTGVGRLTGCLDHIKCFFFSAVNVRICMQYDT